MTKARVLLSLLLLLIAAPANAVGVQNDGNSPGTIKWGGLGEAGSSIMTYRGSWNGFYGGLLYEESANFLIWMDGSNILAVKSMAPEGDTGMIAWTYAPNWDNRVHQLDLIIDTAFPGGQVSFYFDGQQVSQSQTHYNMRPTRSFAPNLNDGSTWHAADGVGIMSGSALTTAGSFTPVYLTGFMYGGWDNTLGQGEWFPMGLVEILDISLTTPEYPDCFCGL